jgi:hypothetical protein
VGSFLSFLATVAQSSNSLAFATFTPVCGFSIPQARRALEKLLKYFRTWRRRTGDILSTSALVGTRPTFFANSRIVATISFLVTFFSPYAEMKKATRFGWLSILVFALGFSLLLIADC